MRIINIKPVLRICIFQTPVKEANDERLAPVDIGLATCLPFKQISYDIRHFEYDVGVKGQKNNCVFSKTRFSSAAEEQQTDQRASLIPPMPFQLS